MSGSKSKNKGNTFEREIASFLSNQYDESFVRAAHSGAYIGGSNTHRKEHLSENQIKSFKGDIIPPDSWSSFNAEAKSYADFPFHLPLSGECKVLDGWIDQLMSVAEINDCNILFMKFNRKGRYVCVQSNLTWVSDNFMYYTSKKRGDWLIFEFDTFFKLNKDLLKTYSTGSSDIKSNLIQNVQTQNILVNLNSN